MYYTYMRECSVRRSLFCCCFAGHRLVIIMIIMIIIISIRQTCNTPTTTTNNNNHSNSNDNSNSNNNSKASHREYSVGHRSDHIWLLKRYTELAPLLPNQLNSTEHAIAVVVVIVY